MYLFQLTAERGKGCVPMACQPVYQAAATGSLVLKETTWWRTESIVREMTAKYIATRTDFWSDTLLILASARRLAGCSLFKGGTLGNELWVG